jgi:hypothetical protein
LYPAAAVEAAVCGAGAATGTPSAHYTEDVISLHRHVALILAVVALLAVALFALGLTLCIDWGGASAPARDVGHPVVLVLSIL